MVSKYPLLIDARDRLRCGRDGLEVGAIHLELLLLRERAGQRRRRGHRRRLHASFRSDAIEYVTRELHPPFAVEGGEVRRLQAEDVRQVEARIDGVQVEQTACQEPGADQQRERRGELAHDQRALRAAPAAAARGTPAAARHGAHGVVQESQPRRPGEHEGETDRDQQRKAQDPAVERDLARPVRESTGVLDQEVEAGDGQHESERTADDREHEVLGEELTAEQGAPRAERRADGHLPLALHQARERQVGDVRARDDQDEDRGDEQDDQRRPGLGGQLVLPRRPHRVEALRLWIRPGIALVQPRGDLPQLGLCGGDRRPRREPRVDVGHPMPAFVLHRRAHVVVVRRVIDVEVLLAGGRVVRSGLEDAHDQGFLHREVEDLSDGCRIRSEHPLPVTMGEHRHGLCRFALVTRQQQPPELRPEAEELEKVGRHQSAGGPVRLAAAQHVEGPVAELDELIERRRLGLVVRDLGEREARVFDPRRDLRLTQVHDPLGLGVGKRSKQNAVDDAENGGIGAHAKGEGQDEGEREPRHARQGTERQANVADHGAPLSTASGRIPTPIRFEPRGLPTVDWRVPSAADDCRLRGADVRSDAGEIGNHQSARWAAPSTSGIQLGR